MFLSDFVPIYAAPRDLKPDTVAQLGYAVVALEKHAGPVELSRISAQLLDGWIAARLAAGIARKTVQGQRSAIMCLWREAAEMGLAPPVGKVRRVRVPPAIPVAWWPEEFQRLLSAADATCGAFACGVTRRLFLRAIFLVGYYTGLRPGDLLLLRSGDVIVSGRVVVVQSKTQQVIDVTLPADCLAAIQATHPEDRSLLFPVSRDLLAAWVRRLRKTAGCQGTPKWLRRTGATRCEQQQPGSAMAYLEHKTPGLAHKHYIDARQIQSQRPMPPALG